MKSTLNLIIIIICFILMVSCTDSDSTSSGTFTIAFVNNSTYSMDLQMKQGETIRVQFTNVPAGNNSDDQDAFEVGNYSISYTLHTSAMVPAIITYSNMSFSPEKDVYYAFVMTASNYFDIQEYRD